MVIREWEKLTDFLWKFLLIILLDLITGRAAVNSSVCSWLLIKSRERGNYGAYSQGGCTPDVVHRKVELLMCFLWKYTGFSRKTKGKERAAQ